MKYKNIKKIIFVLSMSVFLPFVTNAMTLSVVNKGGDIKIGDIVILDVYLSTEENQEINAIEGVINFEGDQKIKQITTAGSVFDLWPNKPSFDDSKISFVGGSASSVFGNKLKLFSVVVEIDSDEEIIFEPEYINAYLNDGIGTKISVEEVKSNIKITDSDRETKNEFEKLIFSDRQSPNDFDIFVGRDEDAFDGKYFISFNTTDNESGIDRYEVIENDSKTPVLTGTTYVLQDQSLKGTLIVRAIDHAGNVKIEEIKVSDHVSEGRPINWPALSIAILILLAVYFGIKKIKPKNK